MISWWFCYYNQKINDNKDNTRGGDWLEETHQSTFQPNPIFFFHSNLLAELTSILIVG